MLSLLLLQSMLRSPTQWSYLGKFVCRISKFETSCILEKIRCQFVDRDGVLLVIGWL
jgi:hypothetical protein